MSQVPYHLLAAAVLKTLMDVNAPAINAGDLKDYSHVAAAANQHLARQLISIFFPTFVRTDELEASDRRLDDVKFQMWYQLDGPDPPKSVQMLWKLLHELNNKVVDHTNQLQEFKSELNDLRKELKELGQQVQQLRQLDLAKQSD